MRTAFSTNNGMFRYAQHDKNIIPFLLDMTKPRSVFLCHSEHSEGNPYTNLRMKKCLPEP